MIRIFLILSLILSFPVSGVASSAPLDTATYHKLVQDLRPVRATVFSADGKQVVIRCGSSTLVKKGDLFTVYGKGRPIGDPETGNILGFLKKPAALVQVVSVDEGLCVCRIVKSFLRVEPGLPATRFSEIKAAFFSSQRNSPAVLRLRDRLKKDLPSIIWISKGQGEETGADLVFRMESRELRIYGPDSELLWTYPLSTQTTMTDRARLISPGKRLPDVLSTDFPWKKLTLLGRLPARAIQVSVTDLDGDNAREIIYLTETGLYIGIFREKGLVSSFDIATPGTPQGFSCLPGEGWLALNILIPKAGMASSLLRYRTRELILVQRDINLWLSFVDKEGEGISFMGQGFDPETGYAQDLYLLSPADTGIQYASRPRLPMPIKIDKALWQDLNCNGVPELITLDFDGKLRIFESGLLLWSQDPDIKTGMPKGKISHLVPCSRMGGRPALVICSLERDENDGPGVLHSLFWTGSEYAFSLPSKPFDGEICGISRDGNGGLIVAIGRNDEGKGQETLIYLLN